MRKFYLTSLLLCFISFLQAQIVDIPDHNFKVILLAENCVDSDGDGIVDTNVDTNLDGEIQVSEALAVNILFLVSCGNCSEDMWISSLEGIESFENLEQLIIYESTITSFNWNLPNLTNLNLSYTHISDLDLSNTPLLEELYFIQAPSIQFLESINLKNGSPIGALGLDNVSNLEYVCVDQSELEYVQTLANQNNQDYVINSYCSFIPGGTVYYITGENTLDTNNNGCDVNDSLYPYLKFNITGATETGTYISDSSGSFSFALLEGTQTITPDIENPNYFSVSPSSVTVNFPTDTSPFVQDFCVTPNGVFNDLEVTLIPLNEARPGFDADYKILYKNKGNTTLSGTLDLLYAGDLMTFLSANPTEDTQTVNTLSWNYTNLLPFESREILVTMDLNTPTDADFPLNDGDELGFTATINPVATDETPSDNIFNLKQIVVNSFDPNDKTCLEGEVITPDMVGDYVHYLIRFENLGTANAVNIVVKDEINTSMFDISSLIPLDASHDFVTNLRDTNIVEFIFEDIQLPFDDANNDGYVVFKIRTLDTLVEGNTFENNAEIYFDFNFPIITNTAVTTVETLSIEENNLSNLKVFPNPVNDVITINSNEPIQSVAIYNMSGQLLQQINILGNSTYKEINMSSLSAGFYFVKVNSNTGETIQKIVKE